MPDLDPTTIRQQFEEEGFVIIPDFVGPVEFAEIDRKVEWFIAQVVPGLPTDQVYFEDREDPSTLKQIQKLHEHSELASVLFASPFETLAATLLGEPVVGRNLQYFNKPPGVSRPTPPHQDGHYFMLTPPHAVTLWLALDDVAPQQGCVRYVRGSHRRGLQPHEASGVLGFSQHLVRYSPERAEEVCGTCSAGTVIAHHALTIHRADANATADRARRALGFIYYGTSARADDDAHAAYQARLAADLAERGEI